MVAIVKFLQHGLLLSGPVYEDVATPQQASMEQYNIVRYLGGSAPYIQRPGYGISSDIPPHCNLQQVHLLSRHGERYPSKGDGIYFESVLEKFKSHMEPFKGSLSFLNEYKYFVADKQNYEKETAPWNSKGPYAGTSDELRHGAAFRKKYGRLYKKGAVVPVFTSNSQRCHQSANFFVRGFLGDSYKDELVDFVIVSEDGSMGLNSLTPRYACSKFDNEVNKDKIGQYDLSYLSDILERFKRENPSLTITVDDVSSLFLWCAFEINVKGSSPFCGLFTNEEFIKSSYRTDLGNYYTTGPGNPLTRTAGSAMVRAFLKLLSDDAADNKIWLSFTHDTDIEMFLSSLGISDVTEQLPTTHVPFPNEYSSAELLPQGARIYTEKYQCGDKSYIRYIVNDAVIPIKDCSHGPGFGCEFKEYEEYIHNRLKYQDFASQCGPERGSPLDLTFYWDYKTIKYDAPLIDQ
ncbi:acid phosphatase, secreted [Scheffersomyces stipitis CBS 6054]|uniref:Acid phosphatase, secreted n=1 Tax=Scheffersomyces stipitis (strain ATCC 58785 / CBS 6054 / NBRC 10063 / NRRL Y-11545) TaxID=322104 RepID=A3LUP9_PICST|nr:acid phosphatase, secreted [Scheffersomyces stipitis CBS 6054]ABN66997.2 acid phosphatase, secreted [Scheffersomyces stipitis CBS 6054]